jgi:aspartate carbamoyltransferase catalytic subunit
MTHFNCTYHLVSPPELKLPSSVKMHIKEKGLPYHQYTGMEEAMEKADIIYMTRIQRERFSDPIEYEKVKDSYNLNRAMLSTCKPNVKVLHPLPRVKEINIDVDETQQAYYFTQALNGVYVRQAILKLIIGA